MLFCDEGGGLGVVNTLPFVFEERGAEFLAFRGIHGLYEFFFGVKSHFGHAIIGRQHASRTSEPFV